MSRESATAGIMVLGMHRSGTSALAHALHLAGADAGARVVGGSRGNEDGHWEDAFAVELHERLLSRFGARWDEPFALPPDWRLHQAAKDAEAEIGRYLAGDRACHPAWVVKDPRLSVFGSLWSDAARTTGVSMSAIVLLRHPLEVAASLAARDGLGSGTSILLWAEHTLAALRACEGLPSLVLQYDDMLSDWARCAAAIRRLPGAAGLDFDAAGAAIGRVLDPGKRHHAAGSSSDLPAYVGELWDRLASLAMGPATAGDVDALAPELDALHDLLQRHSEDCREQRNRLWQRIAQAGTMPSPDLVQALPGELQELRARLDSHHAGLVEAFSSEVRGMQVAHAGAVASAERANAEAAIARDLASRLDAMRAGIDAQHVAVVDAISNQIREMQGVTATSVQAAQEQVAAARAAMARAECLDAELADARAAEQAAQSELDRVRALHEAAVAASTTAEADATRAHALHTAAAGARDVLASDLAEARQSRYAAQVELQRLRTAQSEAEATISGLREAAVASAAELDTTARALTVAQAELVRLRGDAATLQVVLKSRSWRWSRPIRALARALRGHWSADDGRTLRRAVLGWAMRSPVVGRDVKQARLGPALREAHGTDPMSRDVAEGMGVLLAPADANLRDIFFWSVIDWNFRTQRPQHLARALAGKGHRVFYVSNNFVDDVEPGFSLSPLDDVGRLFQVHLHLSGAPSIYAAAPGARDLDQLRRSLAELLGWTRSPSAVSIVQHPYWKSLATMVPNPRLVYDCMDHHAGFDNNGSEILDAEAALVASSDLVVVTSDGLQSEVAATARTTAVIRNAADFDFFAALPATVFKDPRARKVIGYYGAIAEWFDVELVRGVAARFPDALVVLVGADTAGAESALSGLDNIVFIGEVPYADLPYWLHGFAVCLLPFKRNALTHATNPVKVYEYLAAGKPVVSVDLPEMAQFGRLVEVAADADGFVDAVGRVLSRTEGAQARAARQDFARGQTWAQRAAMLDAELRKLAEPPVSVIVLTYNNLAYTEACLSSLEAHSDHGNLEVIVVDNASTDGSRQWLERWAAEPSAAGHRRRLILNEENLGFAAGNNVGLRASDGEVLVILNNDTYVTPGWTRSLCAHLARDPGLGIIGPVTNNIGNEARVEISYDTMPEMIAAAGALTRANPGGEIPLATAAFFCVAMPREVHRQVGDLDEAFGVGFFEDDDYCRRVVQAGYRVACAEDVFVHHHLSASFGKMPSEARQALFERNKAHYESKWGAWVPHVYRGEGGA